MSKNSSPISSSSSSSSIYFTLGKSPYFFGIIDILLEIKKLVKEYRQRTTLNRH